MIDTKELVLIWYGEKQVWVSKKYVIEKLLKENAKIYNPIGERIYGILNLGTYDYILNEIDNINTIQIYKDDVVRLHLNHGHYETPKSIILIAEEEETEVLKILLNKEISY